MTENESSSEKGYDPGWNDPPLFSYESHQAHKPGKLSLTKRVVHSFSSNENVQQTSTELPSGPPKNPVSQPVETADHTLLTPITLTNVSLEETLNNFSSVLQEIYGVDNEKETVEIKKRLNIMSSMWSEEKFTQEVQEKLFKMSIALKEGNLDEVINFQRILMVDNSRICSTWMAAIRTLTNAKQKQIKESPST